MKKLTAIILSTAILSILTACDGTGGASIPPESAEIPADSASAPSDSSATEDINVSAAVPESGYYGYLRQLLRFRTG